jgi:uncharacterized RDD family membrane protein YckC
MLCPQCGMPSAEHEVVCRVCNAILHPADSASAPEPAPVEFRPPGIDATLQSIRQDISAINEQPLKPAGFFIRCTAYLIDNLLLAMFTIVPAIIGFMLLKRSGAISSSDPQEMVRWVWLLCVLPNTVLSFIYFGYLHAATGQTIGKWMCGVRVLTAGGMPIGWGRSLVRCAGYFLSSSLLYLGFVWVLLNRRKRGWHDYLAGTVVVRVPERIRD